MVQEISVVSLLFLLGNFICENERNKTKLYIIATWGFIRFLVILVLQPADFHEQSFSVLPF